MATNMKESETKDVRSETISSVAVAGGKEKNVCEPGGSGHYGSFQPGRNNKKSCSHGSLTASQDVQATSPSGHTYMYVYCSHFLSAWGDRMWSFGVGLFLVRIAGDNLQLPATYGLASGLAIFLLGALVGDWVDSTPRLKAAQLSLVLQNLLVVVCAAGVYAYIRFETDISAVPGGWSVPLCHAAVILLAVLADLTSLARVIAVERDWIVKICNTDTEMLAKMTATLRRIDQTTLIVAPIATGQVMTYAGLEFGALFIGAWNLCSVALEYYLMWKVYTTIPALAEKPSVFGTKDVTPPASPSFRSSSYKAQGPVDEDSVVIKTTPQRNEFSKSHRSELVDSFTADTEILLDDSEDRPEVKVKVKRSSSSECCCCGRILYQFITLYRGWRTYMRYSVALAGLALSFLYMTVLGFDNITVAYAVTQGVSESILGILMGVSAVFGMLGTFLYPVLRRRVGLVRTGLLALSSQVACLSLCVVSVWMPGSPFNPNFTTVPTSLLVNTTQIPTGQMEFANSTTVGFVPSLAPTMMMARLSDLAISSTQKTPLTTVAPPLSSSPSSSIIQVSISVTNNTYFKFPNSTLHPPFHPNATEATIVTNTSLRQIANHTSPDNRSLSIPPGSELFTSLLPVTEVFTSMSPDRDDTSESPPEDSTQPTSYVSVILLMAGIVLARFGLWTADLAITQLFLEAVVEKERGVVNGVQSSLNKLMDVLKFGLVVVVPDTQTFGFLIIVSFVFICLGWLLYAVFLRKNRGHFFHCPCCGTGADYERL
ncbi:solute carrier family 40 member 1-like [Littorina saxatilis]|uniref:Solute carrier family 40 protein n=1 Tax=Littorina saxatilis TaxID=31220 RepID=A0AAN9BTY4_9CAEN